VIESNASTLDGIPSDPWVIKDLTDPSTYVLYYGAVKGDFSDRRTRVFRATSRDRLNWTRQAIPVLGPSPGAWDSTNVETPCVTVLPDKSLGLYYSGGNDPDSNRFAIGVARSPDGITWAKYTKGPVLPHGNPGDFDSYAATSPCVIVREGRYSMWYAGISDEFRISIGLATSQDGIAWEKHGAVFQLERDGTNSEDAGVTNPSVTWNGESFEMFYTRLGPNGNVAGPLYRASSSNGTYWQRDPQPILERGSSDHWTGTGVSSSCVMLEQGRVSLWYAGSNTNHPPVLDAGIGYLFKETTGR